MLLLQENPSCVMVLPSSTQQGISSNLPDKKISAISEQLFWILQSNLTAKANLPGLSARTMKRAQQEHSRQPNPRLSRHLKSQEGDHFVWDRQEQKPEEQPVSRDIELPFQRSSHAAITS